MFKNIYKSMLFGHDLLFTDSQIMEFWDEHNIVKTGSTQKMYCLKMSKNKYILYTACPRIVVGLGVNMTKNFRVGC